MLYITFLIDYWGGNQFIRLEETSWVTESNPLLSQATLSYDPIHKLINYILKLVGLFSPLLLWGGCASLSLL